MITAKLHYLRISPRKVRLVANLVKGLSVEKAEKQLRFLTKRAARPILKLLNSAVANAQSNTSLTKENLYIAKITVDPGATLKRWRPRAMGRASPIMKRTSHLTIVLDEQKPSLVKKEEKAKPKPAAKEKEIKPAAKEKKVSQALEVTERIEEEKEPVARPKPVPPARPYPTTPQAKKRFFNRQTFGNVKKYFRRKSI